jgi:hypothetical protein
MENQEQTDPDVPHDDELDVEGPNESAPGHHPDEADPEAEDEGSDGS